MIVLYLSVLAIKVDFDLTTILQFRQLQAECK